MIELPVWILGCDEVSFRIFVSEQGSQVEKLSLRDICGKMAHMKPLMFASNAALTRMWILLQGSRAAWKLFVDLLETKLANHTSAKPLVIHVPALMVPKVMILLKKSKVSAILKSKSFFSVLPNQTDLDSIEQVGCASL